MNGEEGKEDRKFAPKKRKARDEGEQEKQRKEPEREDRGYEKKR